MLRIHIGEEDKYQRKHLSQLILQKAREAGLPGCTLMKGMAGFGKGRRVHNEMQMEGAGWDLPIVIEVVGVSCSIDRFLKEVEPMLGGTLVTEERALVHHYSGRSEPAVKGEKNGT